MKVRLACVSTCRGLLLVAACVTRTSTLGAQDCGPRGTACFEERFSLAITKIAPDTRLIEHQPIDVSFTLTRGKRFREAVSGSVCDRNDTTAPCFTVKSLRPGATARGTLHLKAPAAGPAAPIDIVFCRDLEGEPGGCDERGTDGRQLPVAARYEVILQAFEILHTKARTTDTVWASLLGQAGDTPPARDSALCGILGPPTFCVKPAEQGDREDGVHAVRGDVRVGPFELVPEVDPDLTFWFIVANAGFTYEEKAYLEFMNILNQMASGAFGAVMSKGDSAGTLKDATDKLNTTMVKDCDAVVVNDIKTALNRTRSGEWASTLDARTRELGHWVGGQSDSDIYITANDAACGDAAKYKVTWRIARISWEPPAGASPPLNCFQIPAISDEGGAAYCPSQSAAAALQCSGRSCDAISLTCCRYGWETPRGHRDVDEHQWSGWYSEEGNGLPPGTRLSSAPAGLVTGIQCQGDFCDEIRLDTDAAGLIAESECNWIPAGACPTSQFIASVQCTDSFCSELQVKCCPFHFQ
jgi:hypothetical protein